MVHAFYRCRFKGCINLLIGSLILLITSVQDQESMILKVCQAPGTKMINRKEPEQDPAGSKENYQSLISNLTDYVFIHHDGIILYINDAASRMLGYSSEALIGTNIVDFVGPEDIEIISEESAEQKRGKQDPSHEIRIRCQDTSYRIGMARTSIIPYGDGLACLTIITDITDKKNAKARAKRRERRYRRLIEQLNEGIWVYNIKMNTTFTNCRMQRMLHYSREEMVGRPITDFIHPDEVSHLLDVHKRCQRGIYEQYPLIFNTREGKMLYAEVSSSPIFNKKGEFRGTLSAINDVTEKKETEEKIEKYTRDLEYQTRELEAARDQLSLINKDLDRIVRDRTDQVMKLLKQKDEFIMQLGHDLRTPLTPILGLLLDLISQEKDEDSKRALEIILCNVRSILNIAENSLKLAKINLFSINHDIEPIPLQNTIEEYLKNHVDELGGAGITTTVSISPDLIIAADTILFHEILQNLVSNGIKYIRQTDGTMFFSARLVGDLVEIRVTDNGTGLSADDTEKIFEPFYKSDQSRHDKSSSGLGLSICRRIIEKHGGTIWAESRGPWQGTSFTMLLPSWNKVNDGTNFSVTQP